MRTVSPEIQVVFRLTLRSKKAPELLLYTIGERRYKCLDDAGAVAGSCMMLQAATLLCEPSGATGTSCSRHKQTNDVAEC